MMPAMAYLALAALFASTILYALGGRRPALLQAGRLTTAIAAALLATVLITRSVRIGYPALTGTYEGLLVVVLAVSVTVVAGQRRLFRSHPVLLAASTFAAFVVLALLSSPIVPSDLYPPLPVLRSAWLTLHVGFSFVGLALFTVAMCAALAGSLLRQPGPADDLRDRAIAFGFVFYATGGLLFGAVWAEAAWGRFWGWDPKEIWALVTTVAYAVYLHLRYTGRVRQSTMRIAAGIAWGLSVFTFFGVNALFAGLHSYA
jgi:ABC-type transport system involved in cytochrome c biogenesis permease subunit